MKTIVEIEIAIVPYISCPKIIACHHLSLGIYSLTLCLQGCNQTFQNEGAVMGLKFCRGGYRHLYKISFPGKGSSLVTMRLRRCIRNLPFLTVRWEWQNQFSSNQSWKNQYLSFSHVESKATQHGWASFKPNWDELSSCMVCLCHFTRCVLQLFSCYNFK